jgi:hypothetical protein
MKTKHTAGNWESIVNNQKFSKYWWTIQSEKGQVICNTPGNDSEQQANAQLISCAPELLKSLQLLISDIERNDGDLINRETLLNEAKQLIEKATK